MAQVLNLNNEVVKMRKEVKKARVLTIRRLTRHIAKLKLKKGSEDVVLKNQRRAERLLEEIHAMKPNSTAADRATARLATHPLLKTKIADIKAAVKAFKDARQKPPKTQSSYEHKSEEQHSQKPKLRQHSNSNVDNQTHTLVLKQQEAKTKMNTATNIENKQICESECEQKSSETERTDSLGDLSLQTSEEHAIVQDQTETTIDWPKRKKLTSANRFRITNKSKSDVSDTEEFDDKEYFDDSTEERFYNQSSDSEDSDSDDDFFIGKVKKKKKKVAHSDLSSAKERKRLEALLNKTKDSKSMTMQDVITEESKPSAKAMKLESVFCNSLSRSDQKSKNMKRNVNYQTSKNRRTAFPKNELRVKRTYLAKAAGIKNENKKKHIEQPLHPSWEASKKRREQISQITAFQGKKIKFDDD
ncbi:serum response factor-binding protein 1 isoform 2-T2 [Pangshura tecta]